MVQKFFLCSFLFLAFFNVSGQGVSLVVTSNPAFQDGLSTYRFYVKVPSEDYHVGHVWGRDNQPLVVVASEGVFNHSANLSPSSVAIADPLLQLYPDLMDDSFLTIGVVGPAENTEIFGAENPLIVDDPSESIGDFFLSNGASQMILVSDDDYVSNPSGWFLTSGNAPNGQPQDSSLQVLVMQLTTSGPVEGVINFTIWPLSHPYYWQDYRIVFNGAGDFTAEESPSSVTGCTDAFACNFDYLASAEDESCEYGCNYCLEGTSWDEVLHGCVANSPNCGLGTMWDEDSQSCVVENPSDVDFDGCVGINDFLVHLSNFGSGCGPEPAWACGDPLEYQGYDYETVQIGEQCWFAENLRSENYRTGEGIPNLQSDESWSSASSGAQCAFGNFDSAIDENGRLYNGHAVLDDRQLCPVQWHVPSEEDFESLELFSGVPSEEIWENGFRGTTQGAGQRLKSQSGWCCGGNGLDEYGFKGSPAGRRNPEGTFDFVDSHFYFWGSSVAGSNTLWRRELHHQDEGVYRSSEWMTFGMSIRCVRD